MIERKANMELFRIILMLMVLTLHYLGQGQVFNMAENFSINYYLTRLVEALCIVAVNCYVLISGYFLLESSFRVEKVIKLWGQVFFYSVLIYCLIFLCGKRQFNWKELYYAFFPIISRRWSFATDYLALYVLSPFLNKGIKAMSKEEHLKCIFCIIGMFSAVSTIAVITDPFLIHAGYSLSWFIGLYIVAAYIRKYKEDFRYPLFLSGGGYFLCSVVIAAFYVCVDKILGNKEIAFKWYQYNSLPVFIGSILLFIFFLNVEIETAELSKAINKVASLTFGIFLSHSHFALRDFIWSYFCASKFANSKYLLLHLAGTVMVVFILGGILESVRQNIWKIVRGRIEKKVESFIYWKCKCKSK